MNTVGRNIRHLRKKQGLSQEHLATELHVTRQTVSNWERGEAFPDIDMLKRIAATLDARVNDIIYDAAERKNRRIINTVSLKPVLITPILFFLLLTWFGAPIFVPVFSKTIGGGVAETFLYPLYFGQIILATLLVLCTCIVVDEIRRHGAGEDEKE
jgi:transcriptional regulator with XRE-family HTH domain